MVTHIYRTSWCTYDRARLAVYTAQVSVTFVSMTAAVIEYNINKKEKQVSAIVFLDMIS